MELREKIARIIWEAEPESRLEHFDNLLCGPILGDLYATADEILAIPEIAEALDWWQMNLDYQRRFREEEELTPATLQHAKQSLGIPTKPDR
jgi:hypothetical protein